MSKKMYVGNLSYGVHDSDLEELFARYGTVESAQVMTDRDSGRSKGFGFVEMSTEHEAEAATAALHDQEFQGRPLTVNEARPKSEGRRGGGNQGGYGSGGRGSYGGGSRSFNGNSHRNSSDRQER